MPSSSPARAAAASRLQCAAHPHRDTLVHTEAQIPIQAASPETQLSQRGHYGLVTSSCATRMSCSVVTSRTEPNVFDTTGWLRTKLDTADLITTLASYGVATGAPKFASVCTSRPDANLLWMKFLKRCQKVVSDFEFG
eukprot:5309455-Amphidinium_carterae.1